MRLAAAACIRGSFGGLKPAALCGRWTAHDDERAALCGRMCGPLRPHLRPSAAA